MNKSREGLLSINENNLFYKIKNFFKKLFSKKQKTIQINETSFTDGVNKKSSFVEGIKIPDNKELKELLYLQELFKMGKIKEKDLSQEERIGLEKLYKQQIYELNQSINDYKNKTIAIRKKLALYN